MEGVKEECFKYKEISIKREDQNAEESVRAFGVSLDKYREIVVKDLLKKF